MSKLKINVVCSDKGWIYSEFIEKFKKYSKHQILLNVKEGYDIVHYLPYYEAPQNPPKPSTCWLSHQEKRADLNKKFIDVAKAVDVGLSHSKKYATMLRDNHQCQNVMSIIPGVDLKVFTLRDVKRAEDSPKMIVGYIGREYTSSDRKNPELLKKISELPFIDFRTTGGKLNKKDVPAFYRSVDVVISPASIEGGPMAIQESLASGVPIIAIKGVGVADEFGTGVIRADNNDDFIAKLKELYHSKYYLEYWRQSSVMNTMRQQVEHQTWEKFVFEHDQVWSMITAKSWRKAKE